MPETGLISALALALFPFVAWRIFQRRGPAEATMLALLFSIMVLPSGHDAAYDFPLIPALNKEKLSTLFILLFLAIKFPGRVSSSSPGLGIELVPALAALGLFGTLAANQEPLAYGWYAGIWRGAVYVELPPLNIKDTISNILDEFLTLVMPFLIGRIAFRTRSDMRVLCTLFVAGALIYAPFMMLELRVSPQIHYWVYGYYPHDSFLQTYKWGGWRPQVFFAHGLVLATFMVVILLATYALKAGGHRTTWRNYETGKVLPFLFIMLLLSKSVAAIIFAICFLALYRYGSLSLQSWVLTILVVIVCAYPFGRASGRLNLDGVIKEIAKISPKQAHSLDYRLKNEKAVSSRAREKVLWGWGGYNRGRVFDPETGQDMTVLDGYWLIRYSHAGVFGMVGPYFLLLFPVLLAARRYKRIPWPGDRRMVLILAGTPLVYAIDSLPNSFSLNLPFIMAGAVWSLAYNLSDPRYIRAEQQREQQMQSMHGRPPSPPPGPGRDPHPAR